MGCGHYGDFPVKTTAIKTAAFLWILEKFIMRDICENIKPR